MKNIRSKKDIFCSFSFLQSQFCFKLSEKGLFKYSLLVVSKRKQTKLFVTALLIIEYNSKHDISRRKTNNYCFILQATSKSNFDYGKSTPSLNRTIAILNVACFCYKT